MTITEMVISCVDDHYRNVISCVGDNYINGDFVWVTITEMVIPCVDDNYRNGDLLCKQVAQRATIAHLSPMCQVNLPQNLIQPFPHPNDATHKI